MGRRQRGDPSTDQDNSFLTAFLSLLSVESTQTGGACSSYVNANMREEVPSVPRSARHLNDDKCAAHSGNIESYRDIYQEPSPEPSVAVCITASLRLLTGGTGATILEPPPPGRSVQMRTLTDLPGLKKPSLNSLARQK
ncbi:hypothetical protein D4764_17G0007800 [Takifugu flavidus]|uniref:Uncharacterized protein n=1 Tax=Takifugu flavidus TaxID=433684 RepID=A0A5C6NZS0_9TELE|nr:hypothetical protein D4764_17G0007800 [Takifugu flavidus]